MIETHRDFHHWLKERHVKRLLDHPLLTVSDPELRVDIVTPNSDLLHVLCRLWLSRPFWRCLQAIKRLVPPKGFVIHKCFFLYLNLCLNFEIFL